MKHALAGVASPGAPPSVDVRPDPSAPPRLFVGPCPVAHARWAVKYFHYSKKMPTHTWRFGVWENNKFVGVVLFGVGATPHIASPFGLKASEVGELVRVALSSHRTSTSKIVMLCVRMLRKTSPGVRLLVSYADSEQGHLGTLYQACGWTYIGPTFQQYIVLGGVMQHPRTLGSKYGKNGQSIASLRKFVDPKAHRVEKPPKHKYVYALDPALRQLIEGMKLPYPKKAG